MEGRRDRKPAARANGDVAMIKCPFYKRHSKVEIRCEGVMEGTSCSINFVKPTKKAWYQRTYCECHYKACEHYRVLMEHKYSDE